jgi:hypothetical protein
LPETKRRVAMTKVRRIDLNTVGDLDQAIQDLCTNMGAGGFRLVSSFVYQTQLVLIFQS